MPRSVQMIFDGCDASVAFLDLVRSPRLSSRTTDKHWLDWIPTLLYGEALRYYESLPADCQADWVQLRDAMVRRFPGPVLSGGIVARSPTRWDQSGLPTPAQPPPTTTSKIAATPPSPPPKDSQVAKQGNGTPGTTQSYMMGLARRIPLNRSPQLDPPITVFSFIIESIQGRTARRPLPASLEAKVDLQDQVAVQSAREKPLITIKKSDVKNCRVGFTYCVNHGTASIGAQHKVLWPREFKTSYKSYLWQALITPERGAVLYHPLAEFLYHGQPFMTTPNHNGTGPTAEYTIQSFFQQSSSGRSENLADITWIINVV